MELLSPIGRKDFDLNRTPLKPCGGTNAGTVHFETTPGSRNMFAWKIVHPSPTGNCTVRVGDAPTEAALKLVKPTDGSAHENGSFPCGRTEAQYEGKEFKIPATLECDTCVVQIEWETEKGTQHMCSDFMSIGTEIPECFGQCLNGGTCANGKCACPPYFSGSNCQVEDTNRDAGVVAGPSILETLGEDAWILIVYAVMLALIAGFLIGAYILYKMAEAKRAQMSEEDQKLLDGRGDKLTSDKSGEPVGKSTYMQDD